MVRRVDEGPIDHEFLRAEARPFDKAKADALLRAGFDRVQHVRIGDRCRIAFALEQEFRMIDAARYIRGEHQQKVDLFRGEHDCCLDRKQRRQRQHASKHASPEPDHAVVLRGIALPERVRGSKSRDAE